MKALMIDVVVGLGLAAAVVVIALCSTFDSTFLYRGF